MRATRLLTFSAAALLVAGVASADCRYTAKRQASIDVTGATKIRVLGHAGTLRVTGQPGVAQARATGDACASSERLLNDVVLRATRSGDEVTIEAVMPDSSWGWSSEARLDMDVVLPDSVAVDVDDGSGDTTVSNVASLSVDDGSGDLTIRNVAGSVKFDDGSGDVDVTNVGGDVRAEDGSGDVKIDQVRGSVIIEDDGSGDLEISNVARDVAVDDDGSGSIDVSDVKGSFTVRDDGSGGIYTRNVAGTVTIPRD